MTEDEITPEPDTGDESQLGDAGKRALVAERRAKKSVEQALHKANERIAELERGDLVREVAASKGLSEKLAQRLTGTTREELERDADDLVALLQPASDSGTGKPKEQLRAGAASQADPAEDAAGIAAQILK